MTNLTLKRRIEYIDILRGLCILWVIWIHLPSLNFTHYPLRMPLFFFLSGIFFKEYALDEFIFKKINTLFIPFIFFSLIGYLHQLSTYEFFSHFSSHGEDASFDFSSIFSMFSVIWTGDVILNPPLWFIAALLFFQILLYCIIRIFRSMKWRVLSCLALSAVMIHSSINTGVFLYSNFWLFPFYCTGFLIGKPLLRYIDTTSLKKMSAFIVCSLVIFTASIIIPDSGNPLVAKIIDIISFSILIAGFIVLFKYLSRFRIFHYLKFWGSNSYAVLGLHWAAMQVLSTFYSVIFSTTHASPVSKILIFCLTVATLYPVIIFMNRYCPMLVGKKDLIKHKTAERSKRPAVTTQMD